MNRTNLKLYLFFSVALITSIATAQNFIDSSSWSPGQGHQGLFRAYGATDENVREEGLDPYGNTSVLWRAQSNTDNSTVRNERPDGGVYTHIFPIEHTKNYRFHIWIKKEVSTAGTTYFGLHSYPETSTRITRRLDGATNSNPYFWYGDLPSLGKWYLLVGYMYASDYTGTTVNSAIYDGVTGAKISRGRADFKFSPDATRMRLRALMYATASTEAYQHYFAPSVYEVNDQMPTIAEIINPSPDTGGGPSVWTQNGLDVSYDGNVGIGTETPQAKLHVQKESVNGFRDVYASSILEGTDSRLQVLSSNVGDNGSSILLTNENSSWSLHQKTTASDNRFDIGYRVSDSSEDIIAQHDVHFSIGKNGNVGIGTTNLNEWKLAVNGKLRAKEIKVETDWSDFVFFEDYDLPTLEEVENHIKEKGHLKDIPSAEEVEANGVFLGEINSRLLQKIEELTLYTIQQQKEIDRLKSLEGRLAEMETLLKVSN